MTEQQQPFTGRDAVHRRDRRGRERARDRQPLRHPPHHRRPLRPLRRDPRRRRHRRQRGGQEQGGRDQRQPLDGPGHARRRRADDLLGAGAAGGAGAARPTSRPRDPGASGDTPATSRGGRACRGRRRASALRATATPFYRLPATRLRRRPLDGLTMRLGRAAARWDRRLSGALLRRCATLRRPRGLRSPTRLRGLAAATGAPPRGAASRRAGARAGRAARRSRRRRSRARRSRRR